jgi:hypothetical protein
MITSRTDLEISSQLDDLRPLLSEWLDLYSRACGEFPQVRDQYYLEQTLTGLIVAAGWSVGVPSVLEARVRRRIGSDNRGGRADVLLKIDGAVTALEAKIHWFNDRGGFEEVIAKLKEAHSDAKCLDKDLFARRLGICFGVIENGPTSLEQLIESSMSRARDEQVDILALSSMPSEVESVQYPGCLILGRIVG